MIRDWRAAAIAAAALLVACSSSSSTRLIGQLPGDGAAGASGSGAAGAGPLAGQGGGADGGHDVATGAGGAGAGGSGGGAGGDAAAPDGSAGSLPEAAAGSAGSCLPTSWDWSLAWSNGSGLSVVCDPCGSCEATWGQPVVAAGQLVATGSVSCSGNGDLIACAAGNCTHNTQCAGAVEAASAIVTVPLGPDAGAIVAGGAWSGNTCGGGTSGDAAAAAARQALELAFEACR